MANNTAKIYEREFIAKKVYCEHLQFFRNLYIPDIPAIHLLHIY